MTWIDPWTSDSWLTLLMVQFGIYLVVIATASVVSAFERRIGASLEARVGPQFSGAKGLFQPIADFFKLLQKQNKLPFVRRFVDLQGVLVIHALLYANIAILPLGQKYLLVNSDLGVLVTLAVLLVMGLAMLIFGLHKSSVLEWISGLRTAGQMSAALFPIVTSVIVVGLVQGGYSWEIIVGSQGFWPHQWTIFSGPVMMINFIVFYLGGLVLIGQPPFDSGHSINSQLRGVCLDLFGQRLNVYLLSRFYGLFLWSVVAVAIYLGGWNLPFEASTSWAFALQIVLVLGKSATLMLAVLLIARMIPRVRGDHCTDLVWKVLGPLALFSLAFEMAFLVGLEVL